VEIAGITLFADMSGAQIAALAVVYASAFLIKGVFGFGAVPLLIVGGNFVTDAHHAVVLAAVSNLRHASPAYPDGRAAGAAQAGAEARGLHPSRRRPGRLDLRAAEWAGPDGAGRCHYPSVDGDGPVPPARPAASAGAAA
jgi:hypothetical protein